MHIGAVRRANVAAGGYSSSVAVALYRRYRPENFDELIGQSQVTDPLRSALRNDRANHAYLFSGPRGCGKTTSARILARCLNCAEGPTDTPCGVCPSCVELSRDGSGSVDVIEIDAASHNGVDDARDLRERAAFAPARDRYKIYILDEAHMVTQQGFNALLKIVEEPPAHVKFIFATTEPEKVIGTIRSRTHHYPFRLVPPAVMLDYVTELCTQEGVTVEDGVLPLVIRAGGGSVRDTLSLLDQIIAGSDDHAVTRERTNNLLGYTPSELLDEGLESIARGDSANAFSVIDRVIHTGNDPRRFVEDVLERLRDLVIVEATGAGAAAVLRGVPTDELERMAALAALFGGDALSRAADIVNTTLTGMTGTTPPRIHLELMIARLLVGSTATPGVAAAPPAPAVARAAAPADAPVQRAAAEATAPVQRPAAAAVAKPASQPVVSPVAEHAPEPAAEQTPEPVAAQPEPAHSPAVSSFQPDEITLADVLDVWPDALEELKEHQAMWVIVNNGRPAAFADGVLTLEFNSQVFLDGFKKKNADGQAPFEVLREILSDALGITVGYKAHVAQGGVAPGISRPTPAATPGSAPAPETPRAAQPEPPTRPMPPVTTAPASEHTPLPTVSASEFTAKHAPVVVPEPAATAAEPVTATPPKALVPEAVADERRGESVVREVLGAKLIATENVPADAQAPAADTDTHSAATMFDMPDNA
ncbi:DNA polymerase-3 subunit gamma/tau [Microbacteriaceae bacterium MWH-Ta3]|nr:DNA polymerase-3 subunit gamma/tau [Microbacteriaceae bacterium MWH-Ta3]